MSTEEQDRQTHVVADLSPSRALSQYPVYFVKARFNSEEESLTV